MWILCCLLSLHEYLANADAVLGQQAQTIKIHHRACKYIPSMHPKCTSCTFILKSYWSQFRVHLIKAFTLIKPNHFMGSGDNVISTRRISSIMRERIAGTSHLPKSEKSWQKIGVIFKRYSQSVKMQKSKKYVFSEKLGIKSIFHRDLQRKSHFYIKPLTLFEIFSSNIQGFAEIKPTSPSDRKKSSHHHYYSEFVRKVKSIFSKNWKNFHPITQGSVMR